MALIKCPECGNEISDTCNVCVHCGFKINKPVKRIKTINSIIFSFLLVITFIPFMFIFFDFLQVNYDGVEITTLPGWCLIIGYRTLLGDINHIRLYKAFFGSEYQVLPSVAAYIILFLPLGGIVPCLFSKNNKILCYILISIFFLSCGILCFIILNTIYVLDYNDLPISVGSLEARDILVNLEKWPIILGILNIFGAILALVRIFLQKYIDVKGAQKFSCGIDKSSKVK